MFSARARTAALPDMDDRKITEDSLVRSHLPIAQHLVTEMSRRVPSSVQRDDLLSAALLGLAQAARTYDPTRSVGFAQYARSRIQGALLDELRSRDWAGRTVRARARSLDAAAEDLSSALGRPATTDEIATRLGVSVHEIAQLRDNVHRATVLHYDSMLVGDTTTAVPAAPGADPSEVIERRETHAYVRDAVAQLPERLRVVVQGYFIEERPMAEIAAELDVTESRVSQMRAEALSLIGEALQTHLDPERDTAAATGIAARRRAAYCAAVGSASDFRARIAADATPVARLATA